MASEKNNKIWGREAYKMSQVVWVDDARMTFDNTVTHKLRHLVNASGADAELSEGMRIALKVNTAEEGYEYGLRPSLLRVIAEMVNKATNTRPVICDGLKLVDYWKKSKGNLFMTVASAQGYSNETLGGHFVINGGFSGDEGDLFPCEISNSELGGVEVGTAVCRSDALWVLSHVTLHPLFGISGALLNGGFECLVGRAKTRVLKGISPYAFNGQRPPVQDVKAFQRRALECLSGVKDSVEGRVFYINYLWDITPQPEYFPYSEGPLVGNLGFLASTDPVALDNATFSLLLQKGARIEDGIKVDFPKLLNEAENLGIGSNDWTIKRLS
jgi:uncharacterized Fe-S center protein